MLIECNSCAEIKDCQYTYDPFMLEIHGEEIYDYWCEDCLDQRRDDI